MLDRAWADKLTKLRPDQIIHFANSSEEAIRWIEAVQGAKAEDQVVQSPKEKSGILRLSSVMNSSSMGTEPSGLSSMTVAHLLGFSCVFFAMGFLAGNVFAARRRP